MMNFNLALLLLVACFDYIGVGLVYPLFSSLLFGDSNGFVQADLSTGAKGSLLGLLLGLAPTIQFFVSPYLGRISDRIGRKPALIASVAIGAIGYLLGWASIHMASLVGLIISRLFVGVSCASSSIVNAAVVDISTEESRARNFTWLCSAYGVGFTIGPMLGGLLASSINFGGFLHIDWFEAVDPSRPFIFAAVALLASSGAIWKWYEETLQAHTRAGIAEKEIEAHRRSLFSVTNCLFFASTVLFCFGWSLYWELISTVWVSIEQAAVDEVGFRYGYGALCYSIIAISLVQHIVRALPIQYVFYSGCALLSSAILALYFFTEPSHLIWLIPLQQMGISLLYPSALANISRRADSRHQGLILGVHSSCVSLAFALSPLIAGAVLNVSMYAPIGCGAVSIIAAGIVFCLGMARKDQVLYVIEGGGTSRDEAVQKGLLPH